MNSHISGVEDSIVAIIMMLSCKDSPVVDKELDVSIGNTGVVMVIKEHVY